ncbi:hypothetical protein JZ751_029844 [Albula glossodonta]|uniref:DH domain-containing protein n=1 Tax=Albula glossodonta TaxID=121402 RepID=A0A8T2NB60_9TELE|nr:hypothetical protein JZ751_029844 [Albula glossodonta]
MDRRGREKGSERRIERERGGEKLRETDRANRLLQVSPQPGPERLCLSSLRQRNRSISFRSESRPEVAPPRPWSRNAPPAITKRRDSKLWSETFDVRLGQMLSSKEIKRQEAIFELSQGEQDLIEDLKLAKKAYHDPMLKLSIMTELELNQIFGTLDSLIPLHEGEEAMCIWL